MFDRSSTSERRIFLLILVALVVLLLIVNVLGTALMMYFRWSYRSEVVIYAGGAGFILAQVSLLTLWGVLGSESLVYRFPRSAGLGVAVFLSWVAGTHLSDSAVPNSIAVVISLFGLLAFSLLSAPLWLVRRLSPKRIWHPTQLTGNDQFSIGQLLVWTAAVAVCMAVGTRLFQSNESVESMPPTGIVWQMVVVVAGVSAFIAAMGMPLLWGVLTPRPKLATWGLIGVVFFVGPPILLVVFYLLSEQTPGARFWHELLAWYVFYVVMMIVMVGCLLLIRAFGFRFTTPTVVAPDERIVDAAG